jgi:glyoxylase I family protein
MPRQIENGSFRHVSITVSDLEQARVFYGRTLGFKEAYRPDLGVPGIWYELGGDLQLHILVNNDYPRSTAERDGFTVCYPHYALYCDDVPAKAKALRRKGLTVHTNDSLPASANFRQVFVKDPDGNMIEFIGPVPKKKTPATRRATA